jgi:hypothetical protein
VKRSRSSTPPWPESFEDFHQMVRQCLGAQEDLAPLVERIARLLWKRHRVAELEYQRVMYDLTPALEHTTPGLSAMEVVKTILSALAGRDWGESQATAQQLEGELIDALGELLEQQYAPRPAGGNNAVGGATPGSDPTPESTPAPESTPPPPSTPAPESTPQPAPENTSEVEPTLPPESKAVPQNTPTLSTHHQTAIVNRQSDAPRRAPSELLSAVSVFLSARRPGGRDFAAERGSGPLRSSELCHSERAPRAKNLCLDRHRPKTEILRPVAAATSLRMTGSTSGPRKKTDVGARHGVPRPNSAADSPIRNRYLAIRGRGRSENAANRQSAMDNRQPAIGCRQSAIAIQRSAMGTTPDFRRAGLGSQSAIGNGLW